MIKKIKLHKLALALLGLFAISCSSDDNVEDINSIPVAVDMTATSEAGEAVEIELVATDEIQAIFNNKIYS